MSNEITEFRPAEASLVEIRKDPERFPRIANIPRDQAVKAMTGIVYKAILFRGQEADPTTISFIASNLIDEIISERTFGLRFLTLEEAGRAIKKAVLEDSEMYGVNVSSLFKVLLKYAKNEGHQADLKAREEISRSRQIGTSPAMTMLMASASRMSKSNKIK